MQVLNYLIGVFLAVGAGISNNIGLLLQKKVVNELPEGEKVGRNLLKKPLWILGLSFELVLGTTFFLLAFTPKWGIGAALVPGLMAAGLIVLAIGSIKLLKESVTKQDVLGILLMIVGIAFLGFSELEIKVENPEVFDANLLSRAAIFTIVFIAISLFCQVFQGRQKKYQGILLAIFSGAMFATSNFWVQPLMALFGVVFGAGQYIGFFLITITILILTNIFGIFKIQQAFQHGHASKLIPIQQLPIQIGPIFIYFAIFMWMAPKVYSLPFMIIAVTLVIASSFLLARRQAQLEEIK